jgi:CheY-like chemotaxis protein
MKRILVADDSITIQKVIALTFADEPFEVQSVGTGAEALELMKSYTPDIVLADVIMPQMNGYELCRAVKQQEATAAIPVLLLAGTFEAFDEGEASSVGADDFITKPFESGELIDKVNSLLGGGVAPAAAAPQPGLPAAAPTMESAPPVPSEPSAAPPVAAPAPPPPAAEVPPSIADAGGPEPDIWDILSDTGDEAQAQPAAPAVEPAGGGVPGFGPIEDTGVVDVGSFDVGLDRPEVEPAEQAPQAVEPVGIPEPTMPDPPAEFPGAFDTTQVEAAPPQEAIEPPAPPQAAPPQAAPPQAAPPQAAPIVVEPPAMPDMDEADKSRVEDREKDFFGFETGAVEGVAGGDLLSEAVEEVTFDMDETPAMAPEASPEASFVVPEPAPAPVPAPEPVPPVPSVIEGSPVEGESVPSPVPTTALPEPVAADAGQAGVAVDDAAIRKIIDEKVEKIAWEVVPEMAEALIREALEKIKGGS